MPNDDGPAAPFISSPRRRTYSRMKSIDTIGGSSGLHKKGLWVLVASYIFDWIILVVFGIVGLVLDKITPNKRPFSLEDPNISFPFTVHETVPASVAALANTVAPIVIIIVIALIFVPGATVPRGTPKSLIWQRKFWELHIGLLGLGLSVIAAWFITNGMKNMFGKPRPDLLSRCQPDVDNIARYVVGGIANFQSQGRLVSADICKNPNKALLDDGFRSYPSGHSSSSAAGLIYLSLFIASKFAITIPFLAPASYPGAHSYSAFPSRLYPKAAPTTVTTKAQATGREAYGGDGFGGETYELSDRRAIRDEALSLPADAALRERLAMHGTSVAAVRRQAASPPLYLLGLCVLPFFGAVFISGSRWFDFRHHGFDILFGFLIGTVTAIFSFRYYHLPISQGAGWAWGPRSHDKAFWAGIGSFSYATDRLRPDNPEYDPSAAAVAPIPRHGDEEEALGAINRQGSGASSGWAPAPAAVAADDDDRSVSRKLSPDRSGGSPPRRQDGNEYGAAL